MRSVTLNEQKIDHLQDLIGCYYEMNAGTERDGIASSIIGILDFVLSTDCIDYTPGAELMRKYDRQCSCITATEATCTEE